MFMSFDFGTTSYFLWILNSDTEEEKESESSEVEESEEETESSASESDSSQSDSSDQVSWRVRRALGKSHRVV